MSCDVHYNKYYRADNGQVLLIGGKAIYYIEI